MTIFAMRLVAAAVSVAVVLPACGTGAGSDEAVVKKADDAAAAAERSLAAVEVLEDEVASLEDRLGDARRKGAALSSRLDAATKRLWDSLARVRASADDAAGSASSAVATAQSAARDIAVLTQRLNYHLKSSGE